MAFTQIKKISFIIGALVVGMTLGCKKYQNDDRRYLKTACGRIAKKWTLYKITNRSGYDYANDTISYALYDNHGAIIGYEKFVYYGMTLEFDRVQSWLCAEVGLRGSVKCPNRQFVSGYYELKYKRTSIKLDLVPLSNNPARYFINDYKIYKMTKDEFIFGYDDDSKAYFKTAD